jgi:Ulp1 family protease
VKSLYNYRKVLVPININNLHWSLVLINLDERKMIYHDSLTFEEEGLKIMNELSEIFSEYISKNKKDDTFPYKFTNNTTITDKNEEDALKNSSSFTDSENILNDANILIIKSQEIQSKNKITPNTNASDTDSENDIQMLSSFWKFKTASVPQQMNGSDCGVFMLKYIDCLVNDEDFKFTQEDIPYFRYKFGLELIKGRIVG